MSLSVTGNRRVVWLVVALVAVRVLAIVIVLHSGIEDDHSVLGGDARRYDEIATSPGTPYRDFDVEYPPVSLVAIEAVHGHDTLDTLTRLALSQLALELGVAALLAWAWSTRTAIVYLLLGTPMLFFPFPYVRIDFVSVFLAVLAVCLMRRRHHQAGAVSLAAAGLTKLWPFVLAPLLAIERRWRALGVFGVTAVVGLVAWRAVFGKHAFEQVTSFRGARGWQIESFPGVILHTLDPTASKVEQGAWRTGAAMPDWSRPVLLAATAAVVLLAWVLAARCARRGGAVATDAAFGLAPLASILALLVFAPIISPQYVLWLMPFVAVLAVRGHVLIGWLGLVIGALTTLILATIHAQIEGHLYATGPIMVRNVLLVVLMAVALRTMWQGGRQATAHRTAATASLSA